MTVQDFIETYLPWAERARVLAGLPEQATPVILGQWALESGWGTSTLAAAHRNLGGIKYVGEPTQGYRVGDFAGYQSMEQFVADYARVLRLPYYDPVRQAAQAGLDPVSVAYAFGQTPYDEARYAASGRPGEKLAQVVRTVTDFFSSGPEPAPPAPQDASPAPGRRAPIPIPGSGGLWYDPETGRFVRGDELTPEEQAAGRQEQTEATGRQQTWDLLGTLRDIGQTLQQAVSAAPYVLAFLVVVVLGLLAGYQAFREG